MNVKRFTARNSREALRLVRESLGDDAVVLSTKPSGAGVEVLAMAPEGMRRAEQIGAAAPVMAAPEPLPGRRAEPAFNTPTFEATSTEDDASRLEMSTLSFQDYVRKRMLKRRQASMEAGTRLDVRADDEEPLVVPDVAQTPSGIYAAASAAAAAVSHAEKRQHELAGILGQRMVDRMPAKAHAAATPAPSAEPIHVPGLADSANALDAIDARRDQAEMMAELRSMKGLIEERFGALAFMEKLQRRPAEARLTQKLLDCGFSPALIRKVAESLTVDNTDEMGWASQVLERNVLAQDASTAIEDQGGTFALIGATGVGKTTTTAKIAAAFAARHGASQLGLITLDAYRVGAHEQLRAYGRILGVPVHTAHDRASLEDLLDLLGGKKMVLIDTAGMAQRDTRTRELLEMMSHRSIRRVLVVNAASQGETIEDVLVGYGASNCVGVVLSKIDEAVKLGPALDAMIRHKLKIIGVANGQRVPEDWHRLSASALVQRALRGGGTSAWRFDTAEMNLIFAAPHAPVRAAATL